MNERIIQGHEVALSPEEMVVSLGEIVEKYCPEDAEFFTEINDVNKMMGAIYAELKDIGHDPDEIFWCFGVTESVVEEMS